MSTESRSIKKPFLPIEGNPVGIIKTFAAFSKFELSRLVKNRLVIGLYIILVLLTLLFIQKGVLDYNDKMKEQKQFQNIENLLVEKYLYYRIYGTMGFRLIQLPTEFFIMSSCSGISPEITAFVDAGFRLRIDQPMAGSNLLKPRNSSYSDFSGIILLFGSLLTLFYAYDSLRSNKFMKMLVSVSSPARVFLFIILSRFIILVGLQFLILFSGWILVKLNGYTIPLDGYFFHFILVLFFVNLFFFSLGTIAGLLENKRTTILVMVMVWLLLIIFVPLGVQNYSEKISYSLKSNSQLDFDKMSLVMKFEKWVVDTAGVFKLNEKISKKRIDIINHYYKNEFKRINELEDQMRQDLRNRVEKIQLISSFFPTTWYSSTMRELSSQGYNGILTFYKKIHQIKIAFFDFITKKVYFSNDIKQPCILEPFLKDNQYIIPAHSSMPAYYWVGIMATILYSLILFFTAFIGFKRRIFSVPTESLNTPKPVNFIINPGELKVIDSQENVFLPHVYNILSGRRNDLRKKNYNGTLLIDGNDVTEKPHKFSFIYICHPDEFPEGVQIKALIVLFSDLLGIEKKVFMDAYENSRITPSDKDRFTKMDMQRLKPGEFIISLLRINPRRMVILDNVSKSMPLKYIVFLKKSMEVLSKGGLSVVYFMDWNYEMMKFSTESIIDESNIWLESIENLSRIYEIDPEG